jgi:hypothetical protein
MDFRRENLESLVGFDCDNSRLHGTNQPVMMRAPEDVKVMS